MQSFANLLKLRQGRITPRTDPAVARATAAEGRRYAFTPSRSFKKPRRVALPPLNRMELNEKQKQWGIPVYSVMDDSNGSGIPLHARSSVVNFPVAEPGDRRRLSVAM